MFTIDNNSNLPIFEQIVHQVGRYLALGVLKAHDQLPPVRTLAKDLGINPNTVAKAYSECEQLGLIYSKPGIGSFISEKEKGVHMLKRDLYIELDNLISSLIDLKESPNQIIQHIKETFS